LQELERNDARNGSKNHTTAPPGRRPHARVDSRALRLAYPPLNVRGLQEARAQAAQRPGWAAIFVKAFALVAKEEPILRTLYVKWPLPAFYELPRSVAMVAIARVEDGQDCVLPQKVTAPDEMPLAEVDALIRHAKEAPINEVPAFRKILRTTRLPCRCAACSGRSGSISAASGPIISAVLASPPWPPTVPASSMPSAPGRLS
jgi:hypothetical protein